MLADAAGDEVLHYTEQIEVQLPISRGLWPYDCASYLRARTRAIAHYYVEKLVLMR